MSRQWIGEARFAVRSSAGGCAVMSCTCSSSRPVFLIEVSIQPRLQDLARLSFKNVKFKSRSSPHSVCQSQFPVTRGTHPLKSVSSPPRPSGSELFLKFCHVLSCRGTQAAFVLRHIPAFKLWLCHNRKEILPEEWRLRWVLGHRDSSYHITCLPLILECQFESQTPCF